jgi:hypothetical protein
MYSNMETALMIIYNHRYDKNITKLEELYTPKFSHIFHVVPFYDGDRDNVIPVYESSYRFQGYAAQAYEKIKHMGFTHFFFIADDMIINPALDETNYYELIGLKENESYLPYIREFSKEKGYWQRVKNAIMWSNELTICGAEIQNQIPSEQEAKDAFTKYGVTDLTVHTWPFLLAFARGMIKEASPYVSAKVIGRFIRNGFKYPLLYPMVGCYADISIIPAEVMPKFCHYAGVFAASGLFVEIAWATSLMLATPYMKTDCDTKLKGRALWPGDGWNELDKYNYSLNALIQDFPKGQLFYHPVKLSKWK